MSLFNKKNKKEDKKEIIKEKETVKETAPTVNLPKGNDARAYQIILGPHITEKGAMLEIQNKYVFKVASGAGKLEIKKAVEKLYDTHVAKVRVITLPSKYRQVGKYEGRKPGFRKAIVTLKDGERIEIAK